MHDQPQTQSALIDHSDWLTHAETACSALAGVLLGAVLIGELAVLITETQPGTTLATVLRSAPGFALLAGLVSVTCLVVRRLAIRRSGLHATEGGAIQVVSVLQAARDPFSVVITCLAIVLCFSTYLPGPWQVITGANARSYGSAVVVVHPTATSTLGPPTPTAPPAAAPHSVLFLGDDDSNIYAVNIADGSVRWQYATQANIFSAPALANGVVFVQSTDQQLYAVGASDGRLRWKVPTGTGTSPVVVDGTVFLGAGFNRVLALRASDGHTLWQYTAGSYLEAAPAVANNVVYIGSDDHYVYALDAMSGALQWKFQTGDAVKSQPVVANGNVYIGSDDQYIYALDAATGKLRWRLHTGQQVESSLLVTDGMVIASALNGTLYGVNATTGVLVWTRTGLNPVQTSVQSNNGLLYATGGTMLVALDPATAATVKTYIIGDTAQGIRVDNGIAYGSSANLHLKAIRLSDGSTLWDVRLGGTVPFPGVIGP